MEKDMTIGSPGRVILSFTLPIFIGNVFQQFYNMADAIIVGQFLGTKALAAVGSTGTIMFLIFGLISGMSIGFTVLCAQYFGAGDLKRMRKSVASASVLSIGITIAFTIFSLLFMKPLLHLMNTPQDIFYDAYSYIMVICAGIFAQVLYNLLSSILRALGNSKTPLYFLILAAGLNIILDLVCIVILDMGTAGAAYATVISQGISGLGCLFYIVKKVPILHLKKDDWKLDWSMSKKQLGVGIPMALQYSITAIGTTMVQAALNILGSTVVAAFTAASKIEQIVTQAYVAIGVTMATYCAQNRGAGKIIRIRQGMRQATLTGFIYSIAAGILLSLFGKYLTVLFVSSSVNAILGYVDIYLKCVACFFLPLTIVNVYRNGIQGMGFGILPMFAGIAELIGRGVVSLAASHFKSYLGICMAGPMAWVLAGGLLLYLYRNIMKNLEKASCRA